MSFLLFLGLYLKNERIDWLRDLVSTLGFMRSVPPRISQWRPLLYSEGPRPFRIEGQSTDVSNNLANEQIVIFSRFNVDFVSTIWE